MTTDNELLQRAQTPSPPPPSEREGLPPPPDPVIPGLFWPAVIGAGMAVDLMLRVGYDTVAGSLTAMALIAIVASQRIGKLRALDAGALALAAALSATLALRTSGWVTYPALIASACLTFLVGTNRLSGGNRPWISGLLQGLESCFGSIRWVSVTVERIGRSAGHSATAVVRAVLLAGSLGLAMVGLLASGDAVTASLLSAAQVGSLLSHTVGITMGIIGAAAVGFVSLLSEPAPERTGASQSRFSLEAKAVVVTIVAILGAWSAVQISVALGAADQILSTEGLTVAAYAREGFFQLVAVAAIVLTAVRIASRVSGLPMLPDGRSFRVAAAIIGVELLVLIGSSFLRLGYYINEFGLTMLRLSVAWFLVWLSFFSVVVIARATGSAWADRWSHTLSIFSLSLTVLAFAVANPEAVVVRNNLTMDQVDGAYLLQELSGDGLKAIQSSSDPQASEFQSFICKDPTDVGYGVFGWNYGRPAC